MINFILVLLGFFLLIKGSDYLVDNASNIAKRLNIKELVIGMTVVAIGTSLPELVVSTTSAIEKHSDIALGNIIGSNITNLFLILGLCSLIRSLKFEKETIKYENLFVILSTILLIFLSINKFSNMPNYITRLEGFVLLVFCILFIIYNIRMALKNSYTSSKDSNCKVKNTRLSTSIMGILIGSLLLKVGGDFVVDNVGLIAISLGVSEKLISLTLVAFSTSLPELITSIEATKRGEVDMAIGNIVGSNIFNVLLIIGTASLITPIKYSRIYDKDFLLLLVGTILFYIYPFIGEKKMMTRKKGIIFLLIYVIYIVSLLV